MWLVAPVEETDERGRKHRASRNKDLGRGTPEGAPISPLLSNLHMRRFIEEKTHICQIPDEPFDFLGYTFGWCYTAKTG